ncbi:MAG TPA: hypothetical protein VEY51_01610, partial [Chondromyces sp.]|nr:hypothetical protein [Chondromyces sp.]
MSESFDQLYGKKGIDTSYERETFTYRPTWKYEKKDLDQLLREEIKQSIERARTFTIAQNLLEYDELIADIGQMLRDLESRNPKEKIEKLKEHLSQKDYRALFAFEREHSSYQDTGDYELYSLLFHMKESLQVRRDFIDRHFRTQITHETEIKKIEEAERKSIEEWEYLEAKVMEGYALLAQQDEDEIHPADDTSLFINTHELNYEIL